MQPNDVDAAVTLMLSGVRQQLDTARQEIDRLTKENAQLRKQIAEKPAPRARRKAQA